MLYLDQKWNGFEMKYVTLKLHEAEIYKGKGKHKNMNILIDEKEEKVFIEFELDSIPEKRPFLLYRDFVLVSPSGKATEPFKVSLILFEQLKVSYSYMIITIRT